jgi:MoxR-like ATPase
VFHPGPIFTQVLLADEINRTTPKTQSALLEAMAEGQVTIEGETRRLPEPFFVIATQNPLTQSGTFPLPESQLDRFLMRIELGYPDPSAERMLLQGAEDPRKRLGTLKQSMSLDELRAVQQSVETITASDAIIDYVQRLTKFTRDEPDFVYGISPRGSLALLRCARSWALIAGRNYVVPEDIQAVLPAVVGHRLRGSSSFNDESSGRGLAQRLLSAVDVIG